MGFWKMMRRLVPVGSKVTIFVAALGLASCQEPTQQQCGATFCLTGTEFGELTTNHPREDFDFYRSNFRGISIGIYQGDFPTLPDQERQLKGVDGSIWQSGCLDDACSIWPSEARDASPKMIVISVPAGERAAFGEIASKVTAR